MSKAAPPDPRNQRLIRLGIAFSFPIVGVLAIFFFWPLWDLLGVSLARTHSFDNWQELSLLQYKEALFDSYLMELLLNSLLVGFLTTAGVVTLSYPVAFYLTRIGPFERTIISAICLLPIFTSIVVSILGWYVFLLPFGLLHNLLAAMGLANEPINPLRNFSTLVVVLIYEHLAFGILIIVSSLQGVPKEKLSAARLLGASIPRIFVTIVLPLTVPGLIATCVLIFALSTSSYLVPILIGGSNTPVITVAIFSYATELLNWPKAAALSILLFIVVSAICIVFSRVLKNLAKSEKWEMV